ncbi:putative oxidoreductase [Pseudoclavibacter endophyticus]|uniref:Molybdopterin-dependent oxidoreductase n=1 Tax=Pseudoclavibacter endophyticus TaxID=1778590 RepID=A0A6H9WT11_9MICO|nr:molybdopterin-dependent oxidoreductase [Pseudoclavibacter endophyticus]KAB1649514.1 molybdopterin-dependent oxidoreductase [Pseudoclavibacter endophyticus]GGA62018.1 putative oxidoreductase [Pseudoclavibacter endophyticus]
MTAIRQDRDDGTDAETPSTETETGKPPSDGSPGVAAPRRRGGFASLWRPALAGVSAVVLGAGLGELVAVIAAPSSSPFAVIGGALIDLAPPWAKDTAIALFGTNDKAALLALIAIVLLVVAALAGRLQALRAPVGVVIAAALGAIGLVAAITRADADSIAWLPSVVAGGVSAIAMNLLVPLGVSALPAPSAEGVAASGSPAPAGVDRRSFLTWAGGTTLIGILAAAGAQLSSAGSAAVSTIRTALRLPAPATAAPPIPASAELGVPGLAPVITPNDDFYRIDTALVVPQVDPADWRLRVHGLVENELSLTWDELLAFPLIETDATLACVSNEVGGGLIGNARWLGYPIRELLARAAPTAGADMVLSRSIDGFTASTPLEALTDDRDALLAVGMNGEPLPLQHGFPARMVVPGLYGYVSATKWVTELKVTRFDAEAAYWSTRGWSERGPIKLQSRIDVPRGGQEVAAGDTVIAGMAWHQHTGIEAVEVQLDDGDWMPATLATAISADTWVQWSFSWDAQPGDHIIRCRAVSAGGEVQTAETASPAPDGATGRHELRVRVT